MNNYSAFFITKNSQGDSFSTKAELDSTTTFYSNGEVRVPTRNDYCSILSDETKTNPITGISPQTRYVYSGSQWEFQYKMNDEPFTAAQMATINCGATSSNILLTNNTNAYTPTSNYHPATKKYVDDSLKTEFK